MKLAITAKDTPTIDPRAKGGKQQVDTSSPDGGGKAFDGVLADMAGDAQGFAALDPATAVASPALSTRAGASATAVLAPPVSTSSAGLQVLSSAATASSATTTLPNEALGNALMDILGQVAGNKAPVSTTDAEAKQPDMQADHASRDDFGAVLKKLNAKDEAATADASTPSQAAGTPTDLLSMVVLGVAAPIPTAAPTSPAAATEGGAPTPAAVGGAHTTTAAAPSVEAAEMIVSDVAMATHLAPVNPVATTSSNDTHAAAAESGPSGVPTQAQPGAATDTGLAQTIPSTAVSAMSPASEDRKGAPSADPAMAPVHAKSEATPAALPLAFGPTRAIATAIATVAAQTAAQNAATVPADSAKVPPTMARTLTLQMNPAQLGTVDIKLHMTGQALDVQLTVSSQETLGIVSRERDTLAAALHDQTYQLNSLVIQDGGSGASSSGGNAASSGGNNATQGGSFGSAGSDRQAGSGADSRGNSGQSQGRQQPTWQDSRPRNAPSSRPADASGGALFV